MEEGKKLSLSFFKDFLKKRGRNFTDEQISQIRESLYILAELDYLITVNKDGNLPRQRLEFPP